MIQFKKMREHNKQGFIMFENTETSAAIEVPVDLVHLNIIKSYLSKIIHKPSLLLNLESDNEDEES